MVQNIVAGIVVVALIIMAVIGPKSTTSACTGA
jgi:hypothetical protein